MIGASILEFEDLQRLCRPTGHKPTPATVRRWATAQGIPYKWNAQGGIWTTTDALNAALGLAPSAEDEEQHSILDLI